MIIDTFKLIYLSIYTSICNTIMSMVETEHSVKKKRVIGDVIYLFPTVMRKNVRCPMENDKKTWVFTKYVHKIWAMHAQYN